MQITAHPRAPIAPNANHSASPNPKNPSSDTPSPDTPPPSPRPNRRQANHSASPNPKNPSSDTPSSDNLRHPQSRHPAPHPRAPIAPNANHSASPNPKNPSSDTPSSDNLRHSKKHRIQIVGISPRTRLTSSPPPAYPAQRPADPTTCAPHLQSATASTLVRATKKHQSRDKNSPPPPPTSLSTPPTHANYRLQLKIPRFPARFHGLSWLSPPLFFTQPLNVAATILPHTPLAPCEQACYD